MKSGEGWKDVRCGFHLAGFQGGKPVLYHVHCGHDYEPARELKAYNDFPERKGVELLLDLASTPGTAQDREHLRFMMNGCGGEEQLYWYGTTGGPLAAKSNSFLGCATDAAYEYLKFPGFFHLRNGIIGEFVRRWTAKIADSPEERREKGIACDSPDLRERFFFYAEQLRAVCEECAEEKGHKAEIGPPITGICFNRQGVVCELPSAEQGVHGERRRVYRLRY